MGGVAVLHPRPVLNDPLPRENFVRSPMKIRGKSNPSPNLSKSNRRKRSSTRLQKKNNTAATATASPPDRINLVMGEVKILKRGDVLTQTTKGRVLEKAKDNSPASPIPEDLMLSSMDRLNPEPNMISGQIKIADFYAGSAFVTSPPPSSLPLPGFFKKKSILSDENDASKDLRRILGIDLA